MFLTRQKISISNQDHGLICKASLKCNELLDFLEKKRVLFVRTAALSVLFKVTKSSLLAYIFQIMQEFLYTRGNIGKIDPLQRTSASSFLY